ncbi:uncharacterized protein LOC101861997 [Aplysia californica]|uniref:Uncharacterized protein LOC101861997 n=1 Tax=Aplysia californica TaxID=6500 RepID=A0ABM1ACB9_APLCA|nr:uncharacterized protein LOC101861997 [Aplysia californica]
MATDTESMHENMTRLRMRMVQQKLANERERLQRPDSQSTDNGYDNQVKLRHAMLKRQELLDRIRQEQQEDKRPKTYTPRRRYTPSPLPPPTRRSLPDLNARTYHFNHISGGNPDMSQVKHVIEHQFRPAPAQQQSYLPPIQTQALPALTAVQPVTPAEVVPYQPVTAVPTYPMLSVGGGGGDKRKDTMFNKSDFMDMMMLQNAQMHHMVMQQMMLHQLPGGSRPATYPMAEPMVPVPMARPAPSVYHHHIQSQPYGMPPMDYRGGGFSNQGFGRFGKKQRMPRGRRGIGQAPVVVRTDNKGGARPSSVFLFGIILKEIVAALHRIYLNPNGNIYPVMQDIIGPGAQDLSQLLYRPTREEARGDRGKGDPRPQLFQILQYVIENLVYHMTEIMPKTGVLGTHKKAAVYEMIKTGKRFPDGYFWQIELDRLEFDSNGRTLNVGNLEAFILLVGIFLSRSFITTLLMKPVDYGLSNDPLTDVADRNIKMLATCLLFLVRRVSTRRESPMLPMPGEVARYVFADEDMRPVHLRLRRTYEYCENLLREWGAEYIKRLRQATAAVTTTNN